MEASTSSTIRFWFFLVLASCNPRSVATPPYEIPVRSHYVREVPQLPGHAENIPRRRSPSAHRPLVKQQHFESLALSRGNEILSDVRTDSAPNASIVESLFVLFFGAKIGDTPSSPGPNTRT